MKSVSYTTYTKLNCECAASIIICVNGDLTANSAPYIDGNLSFVESVFDSCGRTKYRYAITYNEGVLLDPDYSLVEGDISGIVCRSCLTRYIDYLYSIGRFTGKGITANRPVLTVVDIGCMYMDTTLDADGLPIWWNGTKWIKADGSDA